MLRVFGGISSFPLGYLLWGAFLLLKVELLFLGEKFFFSFEELSLLLGNTFSNTIFSALLFEELFILGAACILPGTSHNFCAGAPRFVIWEDIFFFSCF